MSTRISLRPSTSIGVSIASRVVPATSDTITRSRPRNALTRLDLPTFGRPITARRTTSSSSSATSSSSGSSSTRRSSRSPVPRPWAAETATGSPRPSPWKSCASTRSCGASILFAATTIGRLPRRRMSAISWSPGRMPARASTTSSATWASASAARAWSWIETASGSSSSRSTPPVSISVKLRPFQSVESSLRSRVMPGPLVDDRLAALREAVDEARLADVRIADDGDLHASISLASIASVTTCSTTSSMVSPVVSTGTASFAGSSVERPAVLSRSSRSRCWTSTCS